MLTTESKNNKTEGTFHCYDNKQNYYNHAHETVTIPYHDQQPDEAFPQRRT